MAGTASVALPVLARMNGGGRRRIEIARKVVAQPHFLRFELPRFLQWFLH